MKIFRLFSKSVTHHVRDNRRAMALPAGSEARNTCQKIDAIESEMSAEFNAISSHASLTKSVLKSQPQPALLSQVIEEAALLFASDQAAAAQYLLRDAIATPLIDPAEEFAWRMLLDLFHIGDNQEQFDRYALAYSNRFESSPPQWTGAQSANTDCAQALPTISFSGKLCASSLPILNKLRQMGEQYPAFCIEFGTISDADLEGCKALLALLQEWQSAGRNIIATGATGLLDKVCKLIQPGRRDESDAAWLLMIELLRLMNKPVEHEELCMDYCITFEISPPAFVPPLGRPSGSATANGIFMMPALIAPPVEALLQNIGIACAGQPGVILNCLYLARVDFTAAAPLVSGLFHLSQGKTVELRNTNHLVAALLQLVGGKDKLHILTRKL